MKSFNFISNKKHFRVLPLLLVFMTAFTTNAWGTDPAVDDVIFKEEWGGDNIQASAYTFTGTTTWSGSTTGLAYSSSSASSLLSSTNAGDITTDNFFFVKNAESTLTMGGIAIPSNVTGINVSFQSNKTIIQCTYSFDGSSYETGATSVNGTQDFDIDCTDESTLYLKFKKTGTSSNARLDNIIITVTEVTSSGSGTDPTITFNNGSYTIGSPALDLSTLFTSNSTGTVTYSVKTDGGTSASIVGSNFTATAAGTCTVQAAQAAQGSFNAKTVTATITVSNAAATITLNNYSGSTTTTGYYSGDNFTLPSTNDYTCGTKTFVGWSTVEVATTNTKPTSNYYEPGESVTLGATNTFYAVFANQSDFTRVTSTSDLAAGKLIVVVDARNSKVLTTSPGYATAPTEESSKITPSANMIWTLEASSSNWKLKTGSSYLGTSSTSNNTAVSFTTTKNVWQIGASSSSNYTGCFYLRNTASDHLCLEYYSGWVVYNNNSHTSSDYFTEKLYVATRSEYATTCGPSISADEVERLTSYKDQTVKSQAITVRGSNLAGSTLSVSKAAESVNPDYFNCTLASTDISEGAINTTFVISYQPTVFGDAQHSAKFVFTDGATNDTITVYGRSLPQQFAIVAYDGANYYALDGSMSSAKQATPLPVEVSGGNTVVSCPTRAIYTLTERATPDQNVHLVGPAGRLWGSSSSTDLNTHSLTSTSQTGWLLTTSDFNTYHITNADVTDRGLILYTTSNYIGHYKTSNYGGTNYYGDLYIMPFSSTCTCLDAPHATTVAKATSVIISWDAVAGADHYEVTCSNGYSNTSITGTSVTISSPALSNNTAYTFTVKAVATGSDCSLTYNGNFTTIDCDEVPILGVVTTTPSTATIKWTGAGTSTIRLYSNAAATLQVGTDYTGLTSPAKIEGLKESTEYYYKVFGDGTCASAVGGFTTDTRNLEVVEWQKDAVIIAFNDAVNADLFTGKEVTHGSKNSNVADGLFFSKYFEANAQNKMLGIYNGTLDTLPLSNYTIRKAGGGSLDISTFGRKKAGWIAPGEEIIIVAYDKQAGEYTDKSAKTCAINNGLGYQEWYETNNGTMTFSGPESVGLFEGDSLVDIIGSRHLDDYTLNKMPPKDNSCSYARRTGENDANGYQGIGDNIRTKDVIETDYNISTNRCLLVRKNTVTSGLNAVLTNVYNGANNECSEAMATSFVTLSQEWGGFRIGSGGAGTQEIQDSTCTGLAYLGYFDYSDYYTTFDTIKQEKTFAEMDNGDGTYTIPVPQLDTMACTNVRIRLYDDLGNMIIGKDYKVPIMIDKMTATTADDEYFHSYAKKGTDAEDVCKECDVVIFKDAMLTKATSDNAKDIPEVRDLTIYPGGTLNVPEGAKFEYTVNSIRFRVKDETVPVAKLKGDLITKTQKVIVSRRINNDRYYFFSLPYDCNVSDIRWSNGEEPVRGTEYQILEYDAATRAAEGSTKGAPGHWKPAGSVLHAGVGYNVAVSSKNPKELIFPMEIGQENLTDKEDNKTTNTVTLAKNVGPTSKNNHNWNLIAHPYVSQFNAYNNAKITAGYLECEFINEGTDTIWHRKETSNVYLTMPSFAAEKITYNQTLSSGTLDPFLAVFVQAATAGDLTFEQGSRVLSAPARRWAAKAENEDQSIFVGVTLSGNGLSDQTNLRIRPDFTNEYQLGYDLQKFTTYYTSRPQIYMKPADLQLAFQAVNDDAAKSAFIPVGVYCYKAGAYTFALSEDYPIDEVEAVYLHDALTGETTNLLYDTYTITTDKQLYTNARFSLNVIVNRRAPQVTTDIDVTNAPDNVVRKILINGHVYIQRGAELYDITGKQMSNL